MKRFSNVALVLFTLPVFVAAIPGQATYRSLIKGRVVDEKGRPVRGAAIHFDNSEALRDKHCWAKENTVFADADGKFVHQEYCREIDRTVLLFIVPTVGLDNLEQPIDAPFWPQLRLNDKKFAGLPVKIHRDQEIDLGNVPVEVWYNPVELFITDPEGRPYYKSEHDWAKFALIVRDQRGYAVGSQTLSTSGIWESVRIDRGSVNLALPEGNWTLELLRDIGDIDQNGKTKSYLAHTTVSIKKTDVCSQARLVIR